MEETTSSPESSSGNARILFEARRKYADINSGYFALSRPVVEGGKDPIQFLMY